MINSSIAKSGYQALGYYDTNSDNVIDATDTRFNELKLWIDGNGDGVTDQGELKTLTEMGAPQGGLSGSAIHLLTSSPPHLLTSSPLSPSITPPPLISLQ